MRTYDTVGRVGGDPVTCLDPQGQERRYGVRGRTVELCVCDFDVVRARLRGGFRYTTFPKRITSCTGP